MPRFEIWMEGYRAGCEHQTATLIGTVEAEDFKSACQKVNECDKNYDPERNAHWGRRFFDNEFDAKKSFG